MFIKLNLPEVKLDLRSRNDRIYVWDVLRKKELLLTPEEWVRQHVVHFFINETKTPSGLIALEKTLKFNDKQRRFDMVIYGKDTLPKLLVECKAPDVVISNETILQIAHYNNKLNVNYLLVTNGLNHCMLFINHKTGKLDVLEEVPQFSIFAND
jgi:hypothetical protein